MYFPWLSKQSQRAWKILNSQQTSSDQADKNLTNITQVTVLKITA